MRLVSESDRTMLHGLVAKSNSNLPAALHVGFTFEILRKLALLTNCTRKLALLYVALSRVEPLCVLVEVAAVGPKMSTTPACLLTLRFDELIMPCVRRCGVRWRLQPNDFLKRFE